MRIYLYQNDVRAMAAAVAALHEPRPFHVDVFGGPDPDGVQGDFVVASWNWADQVYMAWESVDEEGLAELHALLRWGGIASTYGLVVRGGLAHPDCWHPPQDWDVRRVAAMARAAA
jgi:hypothetical protein